MLVDRVGFQFAGQIHLAGFVETVREDLVDNAALCPVGGGERTGHAAELPHITGFHIGIISLLEQAETAERLGNVKVVEVKARVRHGKSALKQVVRTFLFLEGEVGVHGMAAICPVDDAADHGSLYRGRYVNGHGAFRIGGQGAERGFVLELFAVVKDSHAVVSCFYDRGLPGIL